MNIVKKLPRHVADLIAAGEVVERPSSVVKELVENAVDAGATSITVEISNGGIDLIRVTDNGCGMSRDDAQTCFIRHATSKISSEDDLHAILTLGFRGEALAAISSVSQIALTTRLRGEDVGTLVRLNAGEIVSVADAGCPEGTTISVSKIFYNTPARMKFLKKNATEAGYCQSAAEHAALSHPEIAFHFIKDNRSVFRTPGDNRLKSAVYSVCGREFTNSLIEFRSKPIESVGGTAVTVWGYITKPEKALSSRNSQYFILNGRYIRSRTMGAALEEAYRGSIMVGKYPGCVIHAAADPSYVDVNVHPAKTEIKFADERAVFETVYVSVRTALDSCVRPQVEYQPKPEICAESDGSAAENISENTPEKNKPENIPENTHENIPEKNYEPLKAYFKAPKPAPAVTPEDDFSEKIEPNTNTDLPEEYRTPSKSYEMMLEYARNVSGMRMLRANQSPFEALQNLSGIDVSASDFNDLADEAVDPEASKPESASEPTEEPVQEPVQESLLPPAEETEQFRVVGELFNSYIVVELKDEVMYIDKHAAHERIIYNELKSSDELPPPQILLEPVIIPASREDLTILDEHRDRLLAAGIELEDFGGGSVMLRSIPPYIDPDNAAELIDDICGRVRAGTDSIRENILHSIACKSAIKAGWNTDPAEREALVRKVLTLPDVRYCPHGRPVALVSSRREFEKGFRRT